MMKKNNSVAMQCIIFFWENTDYNSWRKLNDIMFSSLNLSIKAGFYFQENDFSEIFKDMAGHNWFGRNLNGKGYGEHFYSTAVMNGNISAAKSYEKWAGMPPFIMENGGRVFTGFSFFDKVENLALRNKYRFRVTGFDPDSQRIRIVRYLFEDSECAGKKKLLSFSKSEWLEFRKTIMP